MRWYADCRDGQGTWHHDARYSLHIVLATLLSTTRSFVGMSYTHTHIYTTSVTHTMCCVGCVWFAFQATSEILVQTSTGENQFKGFAIVIVIIFLFSLPAQLHFINVSLMINDALFHVRDTMFPCV